MKVQKIANQQLERIDTFVLAGVLTILITRAYLTLTGFPQIGNSTLHVAHVLFGGVILLLAFLYLLLSVAPNKLFASLLGGIGFGLFIDEVGKFVTQDNDYFYKPAIGIMYVCFLLIWFICRFVIVRKSKQPFLAQAEWPRKLWMRQIIIMWVSVQTVFAGMTIGYSFATNESTRALQVTTAGAIGAVIYTILLSYGVLQYTKGNMLPAARIIRGATLLSVVILYPFFYFQYPLVSTLTIIPTMLVIFGLSEISIKQLFKKLLLQSAHGKTDII